jgi:hypothetical protein
VEAFVLWEKLSRDDFPVITFGRSLDSIEEMVVLHVLFNGVSGGLACSRGLIGASRNENVKIDLFFSWVSNITILIVGYKLESQLTVGGQSSNIKLVGSVFDKSWLDNLSRIDLACNSVDNWLQGSGLKVVSSTSPNLKFDILTSSVGLLSLDRDDVATWLVTLHVSALEVKSVLRIGEADVDSLVKLLRLEV